MFRHDNTNDTPEDSTQSRPPSPTRPDSGTFDWSPAPTSRAPSLDDPSPPYPSAPQPISINLNRRRTSSPRASQPQVLLNMPLIQAQAEILEAQTRRDMEETQRLAERHFEEMLDSRGFRVTHACEHCRQRKAKCSGQLPCSRCAKQGILCKYSKHDRSRGIKFMGFEGATIGQGSRVVASVGPIRGGGGAGVRSRDERYVSMPYAVRRNTMPSANTEGPSTSGIPALPTPLRSSASFPPPQPQLIRPTPVRPRRNSPTAAPDPQSRSDSPQTRPWTATELNTDYNTSLPRHASTRPLPLNPFTNLTRIPPLPSTLSGAWTDQVPLLPIPSSSRTPRQVADPHTTEEFDKSNDRRWSMDGNSSQVVGQRTIAEEEMRMDERIAGDGVESNAEPRALGEQEGGSAGGQGEGPPSDADAQHVRDEQR